MGILAEFTKTEGGQPPGSKGDAEGRAGELHGRYDWLDQFRGLIVLCLLISTITWALSGNFRTGNPLVGPTFLNHGYQYYKDFPAIITMIDMGQPMFMFVMGFVGYMAFTSRLRKRGVRSAWMYAFRRVGMLYMLAFVDDGLLNMLMGGNIHWRDVLINGTLTNLALGAAAAHISTYFIRNAWERLFLGIMLLVTHFWLFEMHIFNHYDWYDNHLRLPFFSFKTLASMGIATIGTCFSQWVYEGRDDITKVFRERFLPGVFICIMGCYFVDWIQPAEHHDLNLSMSLMSIGSALFMMTFFYGSALIGYRTPILSMLGKNLLFFFAFSFIAGDQYARLFSKYWLLAHPVLTMVLIGMAPIAVVSFVAIQLDKRGIIIKV